MPAQITHLPDPDTGAMRQIVSAAVLRAILCADGDSLSRPEDLGAEDDWDVGQDDADQE